MLWVVPNCCCHAEHAAGSLAGQGSRNLNCLVGTHSVPVAKVYFWQPAILCQMHSISA